MTSNRLVTRSRPAVAQFRAAVGSGSHPRNHEGWRRGRPSGYTPRACSQVIALMECGLSLTAAAGVMGVGRTTVHRWMDAHEEFRGAVLRGQAARTFKLETMLLGATSGTVVRFCCLALVNAAPEEWSKKRIGSRA